MLIFTFYKYCTNNVGDGAPDVPLGGVMLWLLYLWCQIIFGTVCCAAKSLSLFAEFTLFNGIEKKRCRDFFSDTALLFLLLCYAFKSFSAPLVGLRLLRLCLKLRRGFAPWPHKPSNAGLEPAFYLSLRSVLSFTSYLSTTLFSFANSSFLTPHSSLPLVHFALKSY